MRARVVLAWLVALGTVSAQSGWILRPTTVAPLPNSVNLLTYDLARSTTLMFGGYSASFDTWEWNGTTWTQRTLPHSPSPRMGFAHGYDLVRNRVVLFGGHGALSILDDTWEYDGNDWTQIATASAPAPRFASAMAFDVVRGALVLFGGRGFFYGSEFGDTWAWNGTAWTQLVPLTNMPPARSQHGFVTTFPTGRILLHGGRAANADFHDTWSWDGSDWAPIATAVAPSLMGFGFTFDWQRGVPVMFGGNQLSSQTWLFAGNTWVLDPAPTSPPAQYGCSLAHDAFRGRTVFFAGNGETWEYTAPTLATWLPFGAGCPGSAGVPLLQPAGTAQRPVLGTMFRLELVSVPNSGLAAVTIGFSSTSWSGGALPASLASLGMAGCTLWADPQFLFTSPVVGGRATLHWVLPSNAAFAGIQFYNQGFVLDPGVNALGAVVSNAGAGIIGTL